jgi:hypothetical protein
MAEKGQGRTAGIFRAAQDLTGSLVELLGSHDLRRVASSAKISAAELPKDVIELYALQKFGLPSGSARFVSLNGASGSSYQRSIILGEHSRSASRAGELGAAESLSLRRCAPLG